MSMHMSSNVQTDVAKCCGSCVIKQGPGHSRVVQCKQSWLGESVMGSR